jgi:hypothetical protein
LNLIVGIVDLSKIEVGAMQLNYSNFYVSEMFNDLKDIYNIELQKKDKTEIDLNYSIPEGEILIHSDPYRIKQILSNLLGNAIKFTTEGTIIFNCRRIKDEVIFTVSDTGTGIPDEDQKKIFERFMKFDYHGLNHEGTGIGLSLVEKLVTLLHGRVWLKSIYGEGSTFFFSIPYIPPVSKETPLSVGQSQKSRIQRIGMVRKKILVVEDDRDSFFLIQEILSPLKIDINHAINGQEAVEFMKKNADTSLVLMDMKLPVMNGEEATEAIRKFNTSVTIIAQTAYAMLGDREKALNAGCNDYITKPIESKKLHDLIEKLLM